ncbi:MAG TPA: hypothetical protein VNQ90_15140 [Chthoniobacteraceae bacterium]|nr:hypothetical protein [Chthoniobacteraceae bacterium]
MKPIDCLRLAVLGAALAGTTATLSAQTKTWIGANGANWNYGPNWEAEGVPTAFTPVIFNAGTQTIRTAGNGSAASITVDNGSKLTFDFQPAEVSYTITSTGLFYVGNTNPANEVELTGGTLVANGNFILGLAAGSDENRLTISNGATFTSGGAFTVGRAGSENELIVQTGGKVTTTGTMALGSVRTDSGQAEENRLLVSGGASSFSAASHVFIGQALNSLNNRIEVKDGATFSQTSGQLYMGSTSGASVGNHLLISGSDALTETASSYQLSGTGNVVNIGHASGGYNNHLTVSNGATFTSSGTVKTLTIYEGAHVDGNNRLVADGGTITHNGAINNHQDIRVRNGGSLVVAGMVANIAGSNGNIAIEDTSTATFNGGLQVNGGASVTGTGTLQLGGTLQAASGSSTIANSVDLLGGTRTVTGLGEKVTLAGKVSHGAITKTGAGLILELTGNDNDYAGGTSVVGGTLLVGNTSGSATGSGAVSIASGAMLAGNGIIAGTTTLDGILAPGNDGIGTLSIGNNVTWNYHDDWQFELGASAASLALAGSGGSTQDRLNITGDFLKGTGSAWTFDFNHSGDEGWYKLVEWSGSTTFDGSEFMAANLGSGLMGHFVVDDTTLYLQLQAIPEPQSLALGALGVALMLGRWVRRSS